MARQKEEDKIFRKTNLTLDKSRKSINLDMTKSGTKNDFMKHEENLMGSGDEQYEHDEEEDDYNEKLSSV